LIWVGFARRIENEAAEVSGLEAYLRFDGGRTPRIREGR
jgi:hypothetical protein